MSATIVTESSADRQACNEPAGSIPGRSREAWIRLVIEVSLCIVMMVKYR